MLRLVGCCIAAALSLGAAGGAPAQSDPPLFARFKETVRADPNLLALARQVQADAGSAQKAIPGLVAITRANPRNAEAWWLLALAYANTDQQELSNSAARRAATLKPELNEMTRQLHARGMMGGSSTAASLRVENIPSRAAKQPPARVAPAVSTAPRKPPAAKSTSGPPAGRYVCWRQGLVLAPAIAADLHILPGGVYRNLDATGKYTVGTDGRLRFLGGALDLRAKGEEWIGEFHPKGADTGLGGAYAHNKIDIRRASDVAAGNRRVLQSCDQAGVPD